MAVANLREFKTCTKCGRGFPATTKYFYREKSRKDGLYPQCKFCKSAREKIIKERRKEQRVSEQSISEKSANITTHQIANLKAMYHEGQGVQIRQVPETKKQDPGDVEYQWKPGTVTFLNNHFIAVKTKNYTTSVLYKDILLGTVKVK